MPYEQMNEQGGSMAVQQAIRGNRVRQRREALSLSQVDLAARTGISQGHISHIEAGHIASVRSNVLMALSRVLETNAGYLAGQLDDPRPFSGESWKGLSEDEAEALMLYQMLRPEFRAGVLEHLRYLARAQDAVRSSEQEAQPAN
jgi:transcriptional regulator with XRE-family HTH domain